MAFYRNIRNPTSLVRRKPYPIWRHPPPSRLPFASRRAVVLQRVGGLEVMELWESFRVPNLLFDEVLVRAHTIDLCDIELAIKGAFDAVLDTIGGQKTEKIGINFLKRGERYMTLQGDARSMVLDAVGFHAYSKVFLRKKFLYSYYYGIGYYYAFMEPDCLGLREICRLSEAGRFHVYLLIKHSNHTSEGRAQG